MTALGYLGNLGQVIEDTRSGLVVDQIHHIVGGGANQLLHSFQGQGKCPVEFLQGEGNPEDLGDLGGPLTVDPIGQDQDTAGNAGQGGDSGLDACGAGAA